MKRELEAALTQLAQRPRARGEEDLAAALDPVLAREDGARDGLHGVDVESTARAEETRAVGHEEGHGKVTPLSSGEGSMGREESAAMKRSFFLPSVLVLAALAGAAGSRAFAQSDAAHGAPWEYKVFLVDAREFRDKDDWKDVLAKADGNEFHADPDFKAYILNQLGRDGWELVQVTQPVKDKNEIVHLYLRRPKR